MPSRSEKRGRDDDDDDETSVENEKKRLAEIRAQHDAELELRRAQHDEGFENAILDLSAHSTRTIRKLGASDEVLGLMETDARRPGFPAVFIATVLHEFDTDQATHVLCRFFEKMTMVPGSGE